MELARGLIMVRVRLPLASQRAGFKIEDVNGALPVTHSRQEDAISKDLEPLLANSLTVDGPSGLSVRVAEAAVLR